MALLALSVRSFGPRFLPKSAKVVQMCNRAFIGDREVVGYGYNGEPWYADRSEFPFPAIRWKEKPLDLTEKEKGDWRQMDECDKKSLYRISFCQTFSEFKAPTGQWKATIGIALFIASIGVWWFLLFYKNFLFNPLPLSFTPEWKQAQLRRMLDMNANPITGISSRWNYRQDTWKK